MGKTTLAVNVAAGLARNGHNVLFDRRRQARVRLCLGELARAYRFQGDLTRPAMTGGRLWRSRCPQTAAPGVSQPVATRKVVAESDNSMARKLSAAAQREERRDRVMTLVLDGYSIRKIGEGV